jgi:hypothetical protein
MLTLLSECNGADQVGSVNVGGGQRDLPPERLQAQSSKGKMGRTAHDG